MTAPALVPASSPSVNAEAPPANSLPAVRRMAEQLRTEIADAHHAARWNRAEAAKMLGAAGRFDEEAAALDAALWALLGRAAGRPAVAPADEPGAGPELLALVAGDAAPAPVVEASSEGKKQEAATVDAEVAQVVGLARRLENLRRGQEKLPCPRCGRLIARTAIGMHEGSRPCLAAAAAKAAESVVAAPPAAAEPAPSRRHPASPQILITPDNYRDELRRLRNRTALRSKLAELLGVSEPRLAELITGGEHPDTDDLLTLERVLDQGA